MRIGGRLRDLTFCVEVCIHRPIKPILKKLSPSWSGINIQTPACREHFYQATATNSILFHQLTDLTLNYSYSTFAGDSCHYRW